MGDEGLISVHMTRLTVAYCYTQAQIDEYINRGLSNFMKLGGNIPWGNFIEKEGKWGFPISISTKERFYLARQPFAYCGNIKADYCYEEPIFSEKDCAPITGINLISLTTHETICFDVRNFLIREKFPNGKTYISKGTINAHIFNTIENAIPYITLREVLQETVQFIGNRHIYFEEEIIGGLKIYGGFPRRFYQAIIRNGYFAENVCYTSR